MLSGSWGEEEESAKVREEETFIHIFIEHLLGARTFSPEHPERYKSVLLEFRMCKLGEGRVLHVSGVEGKTSVATAQR